MSDNAQDLPLGLNWKDKRTTVDRIVLPFQNLEVIETVNESRATREKEKGTMFRTSPTVGDNDWRNKLIWGDNKYAMSALLEQFAGKIDLIYIDPPFATGADFSTTVTIGDNEIEHTKEASAIEELAYRDTWGKGLDSFLQMMYDRLVLIRELLSEKGTLYLHCDYRVNSHLRIILDEIFGAENYFSEIIWQRSTTVGSSKAIANRFPTLCDHILVYTKNKGRNTFNKLYTPPSEEYKSRFKEKDNYGYYYWNTLATYSDDTYKKLEKEGKVRWTKGAKYPQYKTYLHELKGNVLSNVWTDINMLNPMAEERLDYPTQKPGALLERIITASSNEGDLVADFFCGSGTTAGAAERLGRKWIITDLGRYAIHTTRKRMLEIEGCKPFEILNIGKYERQYWQSFNFGKKTKEQTLAEYIAFILQLFKADALPGSAYIHGKRGNKLIHIGSVEAPVTFSDIQHALEETKRMKQKELVVLGWEWEMGLHDVVEEEAKKAGIKLMLLNIPREAMDKRAVDAGDVQFFELAYLETETKKTKSGEYVIELTDFVIPNLDLIPAEVKKLIKKWSDYIDYWSVDWDYKNDTFHNQWQSYRTKKDRALELKTDPHEYKSRGVYKVMIKVIDIFGNDTTRLVEIKH